MNEEEIKKEEQDLEDDVFLVPDEIKDFVSSDAFEGIFDIAAQVIPLSEGERKLMKLAAYDVVLRNKALDEAGRWLIESGVEKEKTIKMLYLIETEVLKYVDIALDKEDIRDEVQENTNAPSPTEALLSIQERLSKPTAIAPIKRDYSLEKPAANSTPAQKPTFDIYREVPEK